MFCEPHILNLISSRLALCRLARLTRATKRLGINAMNALIINALWFALLMIGLCSTLPAPSQSDLKRIFREIATNENAYGVIQVVPYSERLPAYMVIANQW
uniref:Uncharacterized protein n=1 Tax=Caenorhabditis japonica TaxID=281687 RepID=A0A8R1I1G5_CAEJA